ncbi:ATP-grasp fold amidoligase family protein [Candidatus Pantoea multigeneris]|uniref:Glycosyltransferase n=1 Tax=Candidatus Pantoea multigeneris TaxID=2608357 RepID=A0ABX0RCB2_9GAMM|nr:ATP-grasp fold amidoligase family protein [Pantoea multigeneris]NIF21309.1 glycosyltransferase [Pantoea multigeneris]
MNKFTYYNKLLDYKIKLILSRFVSDKSYLQNKFYRKLNYTLNLDQPRTFNEKINSRMIDGYQTKFGLLADKYLARLYVAAEIGDKYVIPLIDVFESLEDVDFSALPNSFVIKCNHDSGSTLICNDKNNYCWSSAESKLKLCLKRDMYYRTRERHYYAIRRLILCEEKLDVFKNCDQETTPELYRVHCFSGKAQFIEVDFTDRDGQEKINLYDTHWTLQPVTLGSPNNLNENIKAPACLSELLMLSAQLTADFDYCRIDWFIVDNQIYFSEFTFTPYAGRMPFNPPSFDMHFGSFWPESEGRA